MATNQELPSSQESLEIHRQLSEQVDDSMRSHYGGMTPQTSEGQAIGYAETRKEELGESYVQSRDEAIARDPELWENPPQEPEIIEGEFLPPLSERLMEIIHSESSEG
ncbi:hypothetical protein IH980_00185 [Patescibacteria group bacterium]|nr:hypothetical protein [Patescibacteria group bacterium]